MPELINKGYLANPEIQVKALGAKYHAVGRYMNMLWFRCINSILEKPVRQETQYKIITRGADVRQGDTSSTL